MADNMDEIRREISTCLEKGHELMTERERIQSDIEELAEQTKRLQEKLRDVNQRIRLNEDTLAQRVSRNATTATPTEVPRLSLSPATLRRQRPDTIKPPPGPTNTLHPDSANARLSGSGSSSQARRSDGRQSITAPKPDVVQRKAGDMVLEARKTGMDKIGGDIGKMVPSNDGKGIKIEGDDFSTRADAGLVRERSSMSQLKGLDEWAASRKRIKRY
ncbi:hypothetical protein PRZ48_009978 [Zasmidium cellare]|uniref:Uncharacterized protein n=1 Tax=Zasmidium cellare TaxID=395010 RepID=A0ABR0EEG6_ZASCE|nr:hypothetical protein PRZ48_009978 [Zasmidium cellare]